MVRDEVVVWLCSCPYHVICGARGVVTISPSLSLPLCSSAPLATMKGFSLDTQWVVLVRWSVHLPFLSFFPLSYGAHTHARAHTHTQTHTHAQTHTHKHTNTNKHTHTHMVCRLRNNVSECSSKYSSILDAISVSRKTRGCLSILQATRNSWYITDCDTASRWHKGKSKPTKCIIVHT